MNNEILKKQRRKAESTVNKEFSSAIRPFLSKHRPELAKEDIPERLLSAPVSLVEKQANLEIIQSFIVDRISNSKNKESLSKAVKAVLTMHFEELLDYPYIATYRKDKFYPALNVDQMWAVACLEKEFEDILLLQLEIKQLLRYLTHLDDLQTKQLQVFTSKTTSISQLKQVKQSLEHAKESNLIPLFLQFGLSSFEFSHNLSSKDRIRPPSPKIKPSVAAKPFVSVKYETIQTVLQEVAVEGAKYYADNPIIASHFTDLVFPYTTVSAKSTFKGKKELNPLDSHFYLSLIEKKPVTSFKKTEFLFLCQMETKKLVELEFSVALIGLKEIKLDFEYCSVVSSSDEFHSLRIETSKKLVDLLLPKSFEQISQILREKAESVASLEATANFLSILKRGKLKNVVNGVVAVYYCSIADKVSFTFLDADREVVQKKTFNYLATPRETLEFKEEKVKFDSELNYLLSVINEHDVDYVIIGANHIKASKIKELLSLQLPSKFRERVIFSYCDVVNLLFFSENLEIKTVEEQSLNLAVYQFCPLESALLLFDSEYSRNFCLYLDIHKLIFFLNKRRLSKLIQLAAVRAINEEGIDVNSICHPDFTYAVQFLSGIGPYKAEILKSNKESILSRKSLSLIFGQNVAFNLAPFLIVKSSKLVFDSTRIPPEMYDLANDIASYTTKLDSKAGKGLIKEESKVILKDNLPSILKADLSFIAAELNNPFENNREYCSPTGSSLLEYLTVVPQGSVFKGAIVSGTLLTKGSSKTTVLISEGLKGYLPTEDIPYLSKGETAKAFISSVCLDQMELKLTIDPSFSSKLIYKQLNRAEQIRKFNFNHRILLQGKNSYVLREIRNKHFFNYDFSSARKRLLSEKADCFLFRPVKGRDDALYLTLRVSNKVVFDFPILECDKKTHLLGNTLLFKGEMYSSLDEIVGKAVPSMLKWVEQVKDSANYVEKESFSAFKQTVELNSKQFFSFKIGFLNEVSEGIVLAWSRRGEEVAVGKVSMSPHSLSLGGNKFFAVKDVVEFVRSKCGDEVLKDAVKKELNLIENNCLKTPEGKEELTFMELEQLDSNFEGKRLNLEKKRSFKEDQIEMLKKEERSKISSESRYSYLFRDNASTESNLEKRKESAKLNESPKEELDFSDVEEASKPEKGNQIYKNTAYKPKCKANINTTQSKPSYSPKKPIKPTPEKTIKKSPKTGKIEKNPSYKPKVAHNSSEKQFSSFSSGTSNKHTSLKEDPLKHTSHFNSSNLGRSNFRANFSPDRCSNCHKRGHRAKECTNIGFCLNCKQPGHHTGKCTSSPVCHRCGKLGHKVVNCIEKEICRRCLKAGHSAFECRNRIVCFCCKKPGHSQKHCWFYNKEEKSPRSNKFN